ncbi:MAG: PLP-dependent aminotransferase family protein [Bacillota bacterium]
MIDKGRPVVITLDKDSDRPMYIQIYEKLKNDIETGILKPDMRLPTIRRLALELEVNTVTVINAYRLLEENRLVYKRGGSGTYVLPIKEGLITEVKEESLVDDADYSLQSLSAKNVVDFASASPDPQLFPIVDFRKAVNEVLERDGGLAFTYQDSHGYMPLRESICDYIGKKGIAATADDINIISGAQQGIDIISRVLLSSGDYVFVESPTYMGAIAVFRSRGAKIIEIPLLNDGLDMVELEKRLKFIKPKFIYIMPNFQNPTGCSYSERKKKHLLLLCKKYGVMVLEDDYLSELSYIEKGSLPLKSYDKYNNVIYIKSFSKIFMPGLRVAYLMIPEQIKDKVANAKYMTDISTSGFMQRVLDIYFRSGIWNKHLIYMKKEYSIRYYEAVRASRKFLRGASFMQPNGGLNLWIRLPDNIDSVALLEACKEKNVIFTPGTAFLSGSEGRAYMRLSFAAASPERIAEGISVIGQCMESIKTGT